MTDHLDPNPAVRMATARADFIKGTVRPDAPGMVYYPSIPELCATYDLVPSVMTAKAKEDDWLGARKNAMATSLVLPYSMAVDANPDIVKRGEMVAREMESFDDKVFKLSDRIMILTDKALVALEEEDDPVKVIRGLRAITQIIESSHKTAKTAYDPTSVRPDNSVNINVMNVKAGEDTVAEVARILAGAEQQAIEQGIDPDTIEGEIVDEDD